MNKITHRARWATFMAGVRTELPIALGAFPFGLLYGTVGLQAGIDPTIIQAMSSIVFAGSAQFIGATMLGNNDPALIIWLTTLIVNIRHLLYSADLAPRSRHLNLGWKGLLAYLLTDEAYVPTALHYNALDDDPSEQTQNQRNVAHWYWFGAGITLWIFWQFATFIGVLLADVLPDSFSWIEFTLSLTFIGMIVPTLRDRPLTLAFITAGVTAVLVNMIPHPAIEQYSLKILAGAVAGIAAGMLAENRTNKIEADPT